MKYLLLQFAEEKYWCEFFNEEIHYIQMHVWQSRFLRIGWSIPKSLLNMTDVRLTKSPYS